MTKTEFNNAMADLSVVPVEESKRDFTVWTGQAGARQFNKAVDTMFKLELLDSLQRRGILNTVEYRSIQDMIKSDDYRDNIMADTLMETKEKNYESNI